MKVYKDIHEAYLGSLADILDNPDSISSPRGQKCYEKFNYQFQILDPTPTFIRTKDEARNKVIEDYSIKEFRLYESCTNLAADFGLASKFWLSLANPDGTVNSAYGNLIWKNKSCGSHFETENKVLIPATKPGEGTVSHSVPVRRTPWEWSKQCLIDDKDTRQAILRFSLPEHQWRGNKDQTCTLHGIFMIREDKLNLTINMRSNDLTLGLVYDLPWFMSLIIKMRDELKETYPSLQIGTYTHYVHNLHIYERDLDKILKMLGRA